MRYTFNLQTKKGKNRLEKQEVNNECWICNSQIILTLNKTLSSSSCFLQSTGRENLKTNICLAISIFLVYLSITVLSCPFPKYLVWFFPPQFILSVRYKMLRVTVLRWASWPSRDLDLWHTFCPTPTLAHSHWLCKQSN